MVLWLTWSDDETAVDVDGACNTCTPVEYDNWIGDTGYVLPVVDGRMEIGRDPKRDDADTNYVLTVYFVEA